MAVVPSEAKTAKLYSFVQRSKPRSSCGSLTSQQNMAPVQMCQEGKGRLDEHKRDMLCAHTLTISLTAQ